MTDEQAMVEEETTVENGTIYKKWFKSKAASGFLGLRPWLESGKLAVDIGELNADNKLASLSTAYVTIPVLVPFLRAVATNLDEALYNKTFLVYGGGQTKDGPISRLFKIAPWNADSPHYEWKCGVFKAKRSESGAFNPIMNEALSQNRIQISRVEMAEIEYRIGVAVTAYAASGELLNSSFFGRKS